MSPTNISSSDLYEERNNDGGVPVAYYPLDGVICEKEFVKLPSDLYYDYIIVMDNGEEVGSILVCEHYPEGSTMRINDLYFNAVTIDDFRFLLANVKLGKTDFEVGKFYVTETLPHVLTKFPIRYIRSNVHNHVYALTQEDAFQIRLMS